MNILNTRIDLIEKYIASKSVGAELGVFNGEFSKELLRLNPLLLYLVDTFEGIGKSGDKDGENIIQCDLTTAFKKLNFLYKDNLNIKIIKNKTINFLNSLENNSLDYVYIDADHSYKAVLSDLFLSYDKVKNGGLIMGHDYNPIRYKGVVKAVTEFCNNKKLKIQALTNDGCPSYLIINKK